MPDTPDLSRFTERIHPCCPHCADDVVHDVPKNGHNLACDTCAYEKAYAAGRAEGVREGAARVAAAVDQAHTMTLGMQWWDMVESMRAAAATEGAR